MRLTPLIVCLPLALVACEGEFVARASRGGEPSGPSGKSDPSWPAHLLTAAEYNATLKDLLGTDSRPADFFPATSATEFDANIGVLSSLSAVQAQALFGAAKAVTDEVFAAPALAQRILICAPAPGDADACARDTVSAFGRRALRRSLDADEVEGFLVAYRRARDALGLEHPAAIAHVVRIVLSSPSFFLRLERSTPERATVASRLSYLLWGSMPDEALLAAAEAGALDDEAALLAQADRLLEAPDKGTRFVQRFMGQWLGTNRLASHHVDPALYPTWTPAVAQGASAQADAFLARFVTGTTPWRELFTAPHPAATGLGTLLASDPAGVRAGFATLPGFLALTSHADRTSPTARAKVIVTSLFCNDMTPPPGVTTELPPVTQGSPPQTVRARLEEHRRNPACAGCHDILDPLGMSLEHFNAVGTYRTLDEGQPIDASGIWRGTAFSTAAQLMPLLSQDVRLGTCPPRKLLAFALRRSLKASDDALVQRLVSTWEAGTVRALVHEVVRSPEFRGLP